MERKKRSSIIGVFLLIMVTMIITTSRVNAAVEPKVFEHKLSVPTNKVWSICLNDTLNDSAINSLESSIKVTTVNGGVSQPISISYDANNKVVNVNPPEGGYEPNTIYSLLVSSSITNSIGSGLENNYVIDFTTERNTDTISVPAGSTVEYIDYPFTLDDFVQSQSGKLIKFLRNSPFTSDGSLLNVKAFADSENLSLNSTQVYQFLSLKYIDGISPEVLNREINTKGIIKDKGSVFIEAGKTYDINPVYLNLHCALETGVGTSQLANGIDYKTPDGKTVKVYNMYGIGAVDSDPINGGAKTAYEQGWTTPEKAIIGGAKWIGERYIHCSQVTDMDDKDTLYEMRWAIGEYPSGWKQYATDVSWAYKQAARYERILSQCTSAKLKFQIPRFVK
ncbi:MULTISPECIES: glucosaminidase domain-containing protein [Clostridium]|uniref:Mannosyl-glycoprotein endo-beta-N-acetylglucosamidase-like domain-containing protein n=1 Tax=Clostridium senegalense TaxID=1465809 RepID=A0A6M0GZH0_9CLOT|nr:MULTISPECIES: glucosaminidase domain-containing protein [Clostridium]NEU03996.1 hypothetical protein [Clostridium senegalense]